MIRRIVIENIGEIAGLRNDRVLFGIDCICFKISIKQLKFGSAV